MFELQYKSYNNGTGKWEAVCTYDFEFRICLVLMNEAKKNFERCMGKCGQFRLVPIKKVVKNACE